MEAAEAALQHAWAALDAGVHMQVCPLVEERQTLDWSMLVSGSQGICVQ